MEPMIPRPQQYQQAPPTPAPLEHPVRINPMPVVQVLSPVGVEYVFLVITLFIGAGALVGALISLVNGQFSFSVLSFPTAVLVVTVPLFALLFLHLKRMETRMPSLKLDPSKRRTTQAIQIISFVVTLFTIIGFVFAVFAKLGGQTSLSIGKAALDALSIFVVSGGILAYYWFNEHRNR